MEADPCHKTTSISIILIVLFIVSIFLPLIVARQQRRVVYNQADLRTVSFGWPIPFTTEDQTVYDREFPAITGMCGPWECPSKFSILLYLLDALFYWFGMSYLLLLVDRIINRLSP
jgi:hypothetical protein